MICSCGGMMVDRESVRAALELRLTYQECGACGRCDGWRLYVDGALTDAGQNARQRFNALAGQPRTPHTATASAPGP